MPSPKSVEIFDTLQELMRIFRARMRQSMESINPDLTFGELRVLIHVGHEPGCTQKALVERSHADKAQMARTLTQLQSKGWLRRSESAEDRRVRQLHLTEAGHALFMQLRAHRAALAAQLLQDCPDDMQEQLLGLLTQARDGARAESGMAGAKQQAAAKTAKITPPCKLLSANN